MGNKVYYIGRALFRVIEDGGDYLLCDTFNFETGVFDFNLYSPEQFNDAMEVAADTFARIEEMHRDFVNRTQNEIEKEIQNG